MGTNYFTKKLIALLLLIFSPYLALSQEKASTRFVIIADRAGGEEKGVFDNLLKQVNTLSPDFVMSIGDIIDGYTADTEYLDNMWKEFTEIKEHYLNAPFYPVPGNHDISNQLMANKWQKQWGYQYKSMMVNNDMFWLLNTEEGYDGRISETQIQYFEKALKDYNQDGWIYIFMHRPLWKYGDNNGYEHIRKLVEGRKKVVVFSGHEHHYLKRTINGINHYMLSTSGGGNNLRSNSLGEFHHFFFVTMTKDGPKVSNILYNGIISEDIVNNNNESLVNGLRDDSWINVCPTLLSHTHQDSVELKIQIHSRIPENIKLTCTFPEYKSLQFKFPTLITNITPGESSISQTIYNQGIDLMALSPMNIKIDLEAYGTNNEKIVTSFEKQCFFDTQHECSSQENWINCEKPYYIKEDWDWHGIKDGTFSFSLSHNPQYYILKLKYKDDKDICKVSPEMLQDKFFIEFTDLEQNNLTQKITIVNAKAYDEKYNEIKNIRINKEKEELLIQIPQKELFIKNTFNLNIGFMDHDNELNQKPSILWWRPIKNAPNYSSLFGNFVITK